ncbi:GGDEF domain-containing protein [Brucella sp. 10RB9213]|uniref:GGDEF domain-containing protein n=1 Tax=Brucella sp. 10RB9213 TaxID=1844039 RepID=UPI0013AA866F|nr:diguanylate cyclase [Brucella sp. 10RB9213]
MKFVPPLVILLFAATMLGVWMLDTKRKHLLLFGLSFVGFGLGFLAPVSQLSDSLAITTPIATLFHIAGALTFCEAVMVRMGKHFSRLVGGTLAAVVFGVVIAFICFDGRYAFIAPTVNMGLGLLTAALCVQARALARGSWIERLLVGALAVFSAHFIVQAVLAFFFVGDAAAPSELVHSRYWLGLMVAVSLVGVLVGLLILVVATADVVNELQRERDSDPLTGLLNRRGLERQADLRLHTPQCLSYGVIIADIDHFKAINDAYGHPVGDQVLVEFARILSSASKDHAIVGRVGGEEFVLLVSGTAEECEALGNRLCGLVARHAFSKLPAGQKVTSSFGIAMVRSGETLWETAARADLALMRVKNLGRNRVAVEGLEFPSAMRGTYLLTA